MEAFSGVTILTTNFEDTIDTAFKRRITFRLRFEKPNEDARASLWAKAFPPACALAGAETRISSQPGAARPPGRGQPSHTPARSRGLRRESHLSRGQRGRRLGLVRPADRAGPGS